MIYIETVQTILIFLLGFAYSLYFYKDSKKSYELTVGSDPTFIRNNIYYYYIWNSGNRTIMKEDIINPSKTLEICVYGDDSIEYASIEEKTSEYFNVEVLHNSKHLQVSFDFLRPDEGFTIMIKKKIPGINYFNFELKHIKNSLRLPKIINSRGSSSNINLITNLLGYCGLLLVSSGLLIEGINFSQVDSFIELMNLIMRILALIFLLYITPTIIKRIRAPRPPEELELHYLNHK